ncbi:MAG: cytochrome c3 family protein [Candidatus Omnitrophica bacterium]|nr:cytochrome c3 family protein [Candidatus Omnitrophota bacterium]
MRIFFLIAFFIGYPLSLGFAQDVSKNYCISCHDDQWQDLKNSIHGKQGITCEKCHGGDSTQKDKELAKAPSTGYVGVPDKNQIVQICGTCHSNVEAMNFYGIRTDQLARYKTSMHGKKLFNDNDKNVPVCSDCHGYHDVVDVTDPTSPVYPLNVPKTCNRCHGNEKLMKPYGIQMDMFAKYKDSVHGKALFEKKDIGVATCVSCHGSHGALPPGVKQVADACGKCHMNEKDNFLKSPHAKLIDQGNFPQCVACHSNHGIQPVAVTLYDQACVKCHQPQTVAFKEGQKIKGLLSKAQQDLQTTQQIVKQASIDGLFVEEETAILEEAKTKVFEMGPMQHTLSYTNVAELAKQVDTKTKDVQNTIHEKRQSLQMRKIALWPLWIFIIIMMTVLCIRYKQLSSNHDKKH